MKTSIFKILIAIAITTLPARAGLVHIAVDKNDFEKLETLLQSGYDVNEKDEDGTTPLFYAVKNLHPKMCEFLLKKGANANSINMWDKTPLHKLDYATPHDKECLEIITLLLRYGADIHALTRGGETALTLAASFLNDTACELLLKNGADPNLVDNDSCTPLLGAIHTCDEEEDAPCIRIIKLLIQHKANINWSYENGKTALYFAVEKKLLHSTKLLVERGAVIKSTDMTGQLFSQTSDDIKRYFLNRYNYVTKKTINFIEDNAHEIYFPFAALNNNVSDIHLFCGGQIKEQLPMFIKEICFTPKSYEGLKTLIFLDRTNKRKQKKTIHEKEYENNYLGLRPYQEMALQCKLGDSLEKRYPQHSDVLFKLVHTLETKRKLETI